MGLEKATVLGPGDGYPERGLIVRAADELVELVVPVEAVVGDGIAEREKGVESMRVDGVARRKSSGNMSAASLIGKNPKVELREKTREVGEGGGGGGGREGFEPEREADIYWILFEQRIRILGLDLILAG